MKPKLLITFPFEPVSALRMTQGQLKLLKVRDAQLPKPKIDLKNRIKRCLDNKTNLKLFANSAKFKMPDSDFEMIFWLETKEKERWSHPHTLKPDIDNLTKQVFDALCKDDSHIWNMTVSKLWCPPGKGRIEIWK